MTDRCETCRAPVAREGDRVQFDSSRYHMDAAKKLSEISALRGCVDELQQQQDEIIVALGSQGILPSEIADRVRTLSAEDSKKTVLLTRCMTALDDWVRTYADDLCNADQVQESRQRIQDYGGHLAYIGGLLKDIRETVSTRQPYTADDDSSGINTAEPRQEQFDIRVGKNRYWIVSLADGKKVARTDSKDQANEMCNRMNAGEYPDFVERFPAQSGRTLPKVKDLGTIEFDDGMDDD